MGKRGRYNIYEGHDSTRGAVDKKRKNVVKKFLTSEEISGNISRHSREAGAIAP